MKFIELVNLLFDDLFETKNVENERKFRSYINRGYQELNKRENNKKVITGTSPITIPNDFIKISTVTVGDMIVPYEITDNKINVNTDVDCEVRYNYSVPQLINDTDILQTNSANSDFILAYAKWIYFMNDNMYEDANYWKKEYESMKIVKKPYRQVKICNVYGGADND